LRRSYLILSVFYMISIGLSAWLGRQSALPSHTIALSYDQIQPRYNQFMQTWQRQPTEAELNDLIEQKVKDEIYYREALANHLGRDNSHFNEQLQQQVIGYMAQQVPTTPPSDKILKDYWEAHLDRYHQETMYTFYQIYFNIGSRSKPWHDANKLRSLLIQEKITPEQSHLFGDPVPHLREVQNYSEAEIKVHYGQAFVEALTVSPKAKWSQAIASNHGVHLIWISQQQVANQPDFSALKQRVLKDYQADQINDIQHRISRQLRKLYHVDLSFDPKQLLSNAHP
jgi:hypothetical protein